MPVYRMYPSFDVGPVLRRWGLTVLLEPKPVIAPFRLTVPRHATDLHAYPQDHRYLCTQPTDLELGVTTSDDHGVW